MDGCFAAENRLCGMAYHIVCCLCILMCLGPILIIIGIIVLFTAAVDNTRANEISQYNTAVNDWTNTYRAQYAATPGFTVTSPGNTALLQDTNTDTLNDDGTDYSTYSALKYDTQSFTVPPFTITNYQNQYTYSVTLNITQNDATNNTIQYSLAAFKATVLRSTDMGCSTTTNNNQNTNNNCIYVCPNTYSGIWDTTLFQCNITYILKSVCLKVSKTGNTWQFDNTNGGIGCAPAPSTTYPYLGSVWPVETYTAYNNRVGSGSVINFNSVPLFLRHYKDPYIAAAYITDGSYYFGLTKGQKVATGLIIIIIGAVFTAPAVAITVGVILCCRNN